MIITNSNVSIAFSGTGIAKPRTILKASIRDIVLDVSQEKVYLILVGSNSSDSNNDMEIDFNKVDTPSTADVTALYNTLVGYITTGSHISPVIKAFTVAATTAGTAVTFDYAMSSTDYIARAFDPTSAGVEVGISSKTTTGFTVTPASDTTVSIIVIEKTQ